MLGTTRSSHINVWGLTVGFAAAAIVVGLLSWPLHLMVRWAVWGMGGPGMMGAPGMMGGGPMGAAHPTIGGGTLAVWYIGGLLAFAIIASVAGAIIAAVHNALQPRT
jgi:hypothetical protein